MINFDMVYMLQLNMDGVGPAGNDTRKIKDNDPMNITGYENFDLDMGDDSIARVDHELQPMK